jgi:hypothetical protein
MRQVLVGEEPEPMQLEAHNRRGQPIRCQISFAPLNSHRDGLVEGVILVISAERGNQRFRADRSIVRG